MEKLLESPENRILEAMREFGVMVIQGDHPSSVIHHWKDFLATNALKSRSLSQQESKPFGGGTLIWRADGFRKYVSP